VPVVGIPLGVVALLVGERPPVVPVDGGLAVASGGNGRHEEATSAQLPPRREPKTRRDGVAGVEERLCLVDVEPEAAKAIVVMVKQHMPWDGLNRADCTLVDPEEGRRDEDRAQNTLLTHRATQVRCPREELTPLLMHV
jgi:hypothetical protein